MPCGCCCAPVDGVGGALACPVEAVRDVDGGVGGCCCLSLDDAAATAAAAGEPANMADTPTPPTTDAVRFDPVLMAGGCVADDLLEAEADELARRAAVMAAESDAAAAADAEIESLRGGKRSFTLSRVLASSNEIFFFSPSDWLPNTCLALV